LYNKEDDDKTKSKGLSANKYPHCQCQRLIPN
jgi:hypothetical protein